MQPPELLLGDHADCHGTNDSRLVSSTQLSRMGLGEDLDGHPQVAQEVAAGLEGSEGIVPLDSGKTWQAETALIQLTSTREAFTTRKQIPAHRDVYRLDWV